MDGVLDFTPPTAEEKAQSRRQQALYNVQSIFRTSEPNIEEVIGSAKRLIKFIETGE